VTAVLKAAEEATRLRYDCLEHRADFVFETVLSSEEKVNFIKAAHEAGYFIRIFFVCTDSPEINVRRVTKRYLNGGHEVPISKIFSCSARQAENSQNNILKNFPYGRKPCMTRQKKRHE